jgi:hypothetical protein
LKLPGEGNWISGSGQPFWHEDAEGHVCLGYWVGGGTGTLYDVCLNASSLLAAETDPSSVLSQWIAANNPAKLIGKTAVSAQVDERNLSARIQLVMEPEEDILLLGLMMQEVSLMGQMLRELHKGPIDR